MLSTCLDKKAHSMRTFRKKTKLCSLLKSQNLTLNHSIMWTRLSPRCKRFLKTTTWDLKVRNHRIYEGLTRKRRCLNKKLMQSTENLKNSFKCFSPESSRLTSSVNTCEHQSLASTDFWRLSSNHWCRRIKGSKMTQMTLMRKLSRVRSKIIRRSLNCWLVAEIW